MTIHYAGAPTDADMRELTAAFGDLLPVAYRDFIQQWNGIFLVDNYFDLEFPPVDDGLIAFESLFGVSTDNPSFHAVTQNAWLAAEIVQLRAWVIGADGGGNFFVLDRDSGAVFYWDRTLLHGPAESGAAVVEDSEGRNLYLFRDSLEDFLALLASKTQGMDHVQKEDWPG